MVEPCVFKNATKAKPCFRAATMTETCVFLGHHRGRNLRIFRAVTMAEACVFLGYHSGRTLRIFTLAEACVF